MMNNISSSDNAIKVNGSVSKIEYITNVFLNTDTELQEAGNWKEKITSILKKVPSRADVLKPAIQFLVATLNPSKIYMIQHGSPEEDIQNKYFDLLVVLPSTAPSFTEYEPVLNMAYLTNKYVSFSLHNEGNVMEKLKTGHPFYVLNFTSDNIVHDNNQTAYPVPTSEQTALTRLTAMETFMIGFTKAKRFYVCAENEFNEGEKEVSLFMLHQATELICRSITKSLSGYEEKVHELRIQKGHIRRFAPELLSIFNEEKPEDKKLLEILEKGYKDARYNYEFKIEENILPLLFKKVKLFQDTALKIMERTMGYVTLP